MNQVEKEILRLEEDLRDTLENEIAEQQIDNKRVKIVDIKFVGEVDWKDRINGNTLSDKLFMVEKEITEFIDDSERKTIQKSYYLGDKCIGGTLGDNQVILKNEFAISEPEKAEKIKELVEKASEQELEEYSLSNLNKKEIAEVLSVHLGRKVSEEEVDKLLNGMSKEEIKELEEKEENKDELSENQAQKIKVNGIQKVDLNKKVDGKETLGKRLDLEEYDTMYVDYSYKVKEISPNAKVNNTTYALIGIRKDGTANILNNEFEMDNTVGNNASKEQTKIRANSTATRDNRDISVYTRKSNGMSIGCENDMGDVNMFLYQKTVGENENVGIQIETSKTPIIPIETREVMNRNKGMYQNDKVQDEIQKHTDEERIPDNVKDFDGDENTAELSHMEVERDDYIPNTNMTWQEFMNRCGYRGDGDLEAAIEKINELEEVNQQTVENLIEETEKGYILQEKEHNHNPDNN